MKNVNMKGKRFIYRKLNDDFSLKRLKKYHFNNSKNEEIIIEKPIEKEIVEEKVIEKNNIVEKDITVMDTKEKVQLANAILNNEQPKIKKIKKEKGLIERTENSVTILTEDNRELLKG